MWKIKLDRMNVKPKTGLDAIKECSEILYPNIFNLLKIFCTLPVSTATPERMFSCLKRLKSYLRNTMKEVKYYVIQIYIIHLNT